MLAGNGAPVQAGQCALQGPQKIQTGPLSGRLHQEKGLDCACALKVCAVVQPSGSEHSPGLGAQAGQGVLTMWHTSVSECLMGQ